MPRVYIFLSLASPMSPYCVSEQLKHWQDCETNTGSPAHSMSVYVIIALFTGTVSFLIKFLTYALGRSIVIASDE